MAGPAGPAGPSDGRGVLYPARLPSFHREQAPAELAGLVRWFWLPSWNLAPGRVSRQEVLPFPASNLVVGPDGVSLSGPTTRASHRDLRGSGWVLGALLRPAGIASLLRDPGALRDAETPFEAPELHRTVTAAMRRADNGEGRGDDGDDEHGDSGTGPDAEKTGDRAIRAYSEWAARHLAPPDEGGALANAMEDLIAGDRTIVRIDQVADSLGISVRGVQRLARRYVGLTPLAVIRRYRLQEAAQRLREDPSLTIAQVAADLGYADHAHLSADFRRVLGIAPHAYRSASGHS
ncbi:helix-turn-helix transcriptional regulator [Kocuria coralli]|uniref:Helix-turn-helix transcriptional regulator n=1 Tax=Kocuria coralli TaxID=1461025 RepID=A0A5J5KY83_9MICC|nr:helix-turn-helix domain-containing protein [Kocuria coralli]KAA9394633.1 helix-turn-helix transcriptional regulator [Kocuria coralli]